MKFLIIIFVVFGIIWFCTWFLACRPKWITQLYYDIWEKPFPSKGKIEFIGEMLTIAAYLIVLVYIIIFDK